MTGKRFLIFLLLFVGCFYNTKTLLPAEESKPKVAILDSQLTRQFQPNPVYYSWEMEGAFRTLKDLNVSYNALQDEDLTIDKLRSLKILILPGTKNMTPQHVKAIWEFVREGGKVFALGFASYRDGKDQSVGLHNNFQLADLFGADYLRYAPFPPQWGYLKLQSENVNVGRNTAIQIHPHPGSSVIATWLNDDEQTPSAPPNLNAAILENKTKTSIYVGENLFAPENSNSVNVRKLIGDLLNELSPGIADIPQTNFTGFPGLPQFGALSPIENSKSIIRVGFPFDIDNGQVTSEGAFSLYNDVDRNGIAAKKNWTIAFHSAEKGFEVAGRTGTRFLFVPRDSRYPLKIILWHGDGTPASAFKFAAFRGSLLLTEVNGKKLLINELPLEAYLPGVVSHEVPFYFHDAALDAMAIVARTFALREIKMKKFSGYDICATVSCQAYEGLQAESPSAVRAVSETSGKVLTYNSQLADLPYFATCGGVTEDVEKAWNVFPVPYLKSAVDGEEPIAEDLNTDRGVEKFLLHPPDSYCKASSRFRWQETYSRDELEGLLKVSLPVLLKHSVTFNRLIDLLVTGRTPHGRATSLKIITNHGEFNVGKDQIRWLFSGGEVGLGGLQSTLFVIEKKIDSNGNLISATFLGGGWGHGVGLCQFGAEGMAQRGYTWRQILWHYFPGTKPIEVTQLKNDR